MTIDEMIKFLESDKNSNIMSDTSRWDTVERRKFDQIIAALRVGQEMRSCYILPGHPQCPEGMISAWDYEQACTAWDTATQEEV